MLQIVLQAFPIFEVVHSLVDRGAQVLDPCLSVV